MSAVVAGLREDAAEWMLPITAIDDHGFEVSERLVPGLDADDPDISLLICRPRVAAATTAAIYFIHGGGMICGDSRSGVEEFLGYAQDLGCAIVSVEYRLAPENPYPAPVHDCLAGLVWMFDHAAELGIDPSRMILAGASAGGGLAASAALLARDRKLQGLLGLLLECPMLDDRNDTDSAISQDGLDVWDRTSNQIGWTALLGSQCGGPDISAYASPARATDLRGLPPTFVDVGSADTFRDEAAAFAGRIWSCGGVAELHVWPGGCHSFDTVAPDAAISVEARTNRLSWLRRILAQS